MKCELGGWLGICGKYKQRLPCYPIFSLLTYLGQRKSQRQHSKMTEMHLVTMRKTTVASQRSDEDEFSTFYKRDFREALLIDFYIEHEAILVQSAVFSTTLRSPLITFHEYNQLKAVSSEGVPYIDEQNVFTLKIFILI